MYYPMLFVILAFIVMYDRRVKIKNNVVNIIVTYILPVMAITVSYGVIAKGWFFDLDGAVFLGSNVNIV